MRTLIQIDQSPNQPRALDPNEPAGNLSIMRIVAHDASVDLERSRQMDRIDALKILIRSLLDQLDYLTEPTVASEGPDLSLQAMVRRFEAELIRQALVRTGGKQRQAARLLGEKKTTLNAKIIRYGIRVETPDSHSPKAA